MPPAEMAKAALSLLTQHHLLLDWAGPKGGGML